MVAHNALPSIYTRTTHPAGCRAEAGAPAVGSGQTAGRSCADLDCLPRVRSAFARRGATPRHISRMVGHRRWGGRKFGRRCGCRGLPHGWDAGGHRRAGAVLSARRGAGRHRSEANDPRPPPKRSGRDVGRGSNAADQRRGGRAVLARPARRPRFPPLAVGGRNGGRARAASATGGRARGALVGRCTIFCHAAGQWRASVWRSHGVWNLWLLTHEPYDRGAAAKGSRHLRKSHGAAASRRVASPARRSGGPNRGIGNRQ